MRFTFWLSLALLLCPALAAPIATAEAVAPRPPLILITIDTLRADHLGCYGYPRATSPNIDAFAAEALLFENAYAPMPTTLPSHVSLLTSSLPARHGVLSNFRYLQIPLVTSDDSELRSVAQWLGEAGYQTAAFTSASPLSRGTGIDAGFAHFDAPPPFDEGGESIRRDASETVSLALDWLATADPAVPLFLWVHVFDPHLPYEPPAPHDTAFGEADRDAQITDLNARGVARPLHRFVANSTNLYDGEIRFTDAEVGRFFGALRERGLYEPAVIVLTGDHGEGLHQHGEPGHDQLWRSTLSVPLIARWPRGPRGERSTVVASLVDVLPTLRAHTKLPLSRASFDGSDLLAEDAETTRAVLSQEPLRSTAPTERTFVLSEGPWRFWWLNHGPSRLYNLEQDPHELRDVLADHPEVAARLRARIDDLLADARKRPGIEVSDEIDPALRKRLIELGYAE
ncbi:MAG: sulfatase [Myxococcota bacterium]|nr:sulfatase [Myxococcota bacterium]